MAKLNLQDRINRISQYFKGMEMTNNLWIIRVQYGDRWGVYPSDDNSIKVAKSEEVPNEWFYYGNAIEVSVDDIFDLIENTIEVNLSAAAKLELLSAKFEELKKLFATETLERLNTLQFVITDKKSSARKKRTKKAVEVKQVEEATENNTVEETEINEEVNV